MLIGSDVEATGNYPYGTFEHWGCEPARPFAWTFCDTKGNSTYVRAEVDPFTRKVQPLAKGDIRIIRDVYEDEKITKVFHSASFDIRMNRYAGFPIRGPVHDSMTAAHIFTGGSLLTYALKPLCKHYIDIPDDDEKTLKLVVQKARNRVKKLGYKIATKDVALFGDDAWKADLWLEEDNIPELCEQYCRMDGMRTLKLWMTIWPELKEDPNLLRTYRREHRLRPAIMRTEERGIRAFPRTMVRLEKFYREYMAKQKQIAADEGYPDLNFRSTPQKTKVFYKDKGYKVTRTTKKGNPSCDGKALAAFADKGDKLARAIIEYNVGAHMLSGFVHPLKNYGVPENQQLILHPSIRQHGAQTGRMSSADPNLMNIPSEKSGIGEGKVRLKGRQMFGPRKGYVWLLPDFSQIEIWVFAFESGDEIMIAALRAGGDYHARIAERVWGGQKNFGKEHAHYRRRAKLVNFGKIFGAQAGKIAVLTDSTRAEAEAFIAQYDAELPGPKRFMGQMITKIRKEGSTYNKFGRMYTMSPSHAYKIVNYIVQGTAADVFKEAYINLDELFQTKWVGCHILMPLHDEFILEVPEELYCLELCQDIVECMQRPSSTILPEGVKLPVSNKIARVRWHKTVKLKVVLPEAA